MPNDNNYFNYYNPDYDTAESVDYYDYVGPARTVYDGDDGCWPYDDDDSPHPFYDRATYHGGDVASDDYPAADEHHYPTRTPAYNAAAWAKWINTPSTPC